MKDASDDRPAAPIRCSWFHISPDVNDPLCLCSACLLPITADEDDEENPDNVPIRLVTDDEDPLEARFHHACLPPGLLTF